MKLLALLRLILVQLVPSFATASAVSTNCFEKHLTDSLEINQEKNEYHFSTRHILESICHFVGLWFADHFDDNAASRRKAGVPMLYNELSDLFKDIPNTGLNILNRN